jgi:hypothetical protein
MPALITPLRMPSGSHPVSSDHESGTASCGRNDMLDFKHLEDVTLRREAIAVPRSFSYAGNDAIRDSRFRHGLRRGRSPRRSASAIVWDCRRRPISYSRIRAASSARSRSVSSRLAAGPAMRSIGSRRPARCVAPSEPQSPHPAASTRPATRQLSRTR